eukprot:9829450-Alexandrium_andersonii.AAC.1
MIPDITCSFLLERAAEVSLSMDGARSGGRRIGQAAMGAPPLRALFTDSNRFQQRWFTRWREAQTRLQGAHTN